MQIENKPLVLSNARLVLADRVIETGWIAVADGMIAELGVDRA
jgi:alpha-D-ribose 1-methylphosphonate 5-triphosphate diphosphatase